ncbi:MAG: SDR family NAD(P)-dependent oxidoreductase, partial [Leptolyngbyaceae bacterium]|nr:SDR family NAD(P)-dependent oxidoreductase [Leptolyngbyaceae bacterium]
AASMNPAQRVFLQEAYHALEDAGLVNDKLSELHCGVYVGCEPNGYTNQGFTGSSDAIVASRISYFLNLQGPAIVINSGCSSSLVAIHLACESLRHGENDIALAGGISTNLNSELLACLSSIEMLSFSGQCRTFDAAADGTILSEGVSVVVLKRLEDALKDGDLIYGVIKGSGTNQDGKSNGITAPSGLAQEKLIQRIYQDYNIDASQISYIEAHGTGTKLGDPVEANALKQVFSKVGASQDFRCGVGSVKANIGHAAAAAGAIGLVKLLLCMKHRQLPGLVNFNHLNPLINLDGSGLYIVEQLQDWIVEPGHSLMAGINSFGHSGTNAHLVVEEAPALLPHKKQRPFYLICLSAKTEEALKQKITDLSDYLIHNNQQDLGAISYTLNTGRAHFKKRCTFVFDSLKVLQEALQIALSGSLAELISHAERMSVQERSLSQKTFDLIVADLHTLEQLNGKNPTQYYENLMALAGLYLKGFDIDWQRVYGDRIYQRVSLPTYPFAKEFYWIDQAKSIQIGEISTPQSEIIQKQQTTELAVDSAVELETESPEIEGQFYLPRWQPFKQLSTELPTDSDRPSLPPNLAPVIIFYPATMDEIKDDLKRCYEEESTSPTYSVAIGNAPGAELDVRDPNAFERILGSNELRIDRLLEQGQALTFYFLMPELEPELGFEGNLERLEANQSVGLMALFRLVQALVAHHGYANPLTLKVVTQQTQKCFAADSIAPYGADVVGFVQSLAQEYDLWQVSCVDIQSVNPWTSQQRLTFARSLIALQSPSNGPVLCWRNGQFYQQILTRTQIPRVEGSVFKTHGVYLIIGGAGGLGLVLSRYLLDTVQAKLVWVGRRRVEALAPEAQQLLTLQGANILYQPADLGDLVAMQGAIATAKAQFGRIDGVIHSALVLADGAIADMAESTFHQALVPKVQGNVILQQALADEPLDFLLFFSAGQSFMSQAGQSNYAAACTFEDAWARYQDRHQPYPVKIINWGYWGDVGIVATADHRHRMAQQGVWSIHPQEGMAVVERCLASYVSQVAYFKADPRMLNHFGLGSAEILRSSPQSVSPKLMAAVITATPTALVSPTERQRYQQGMVQLDRLGCHLLLRAFQAMGVFCQPGETYQQDALAHRLAIVPNYQPLYQALLNLLQTAGFIQIHESQITVNRTLPPHDEDDQRGLIAYPELADHERLLRTCLQAYPRILRGTVAATDILFPDASMDLVAGVYKGGTVTEALNAKASEAAIAYVKSRLADCHNPDALKQDKITLLEIGAGTGGMSHAVLQGIAPYAPYIEYYYTDISEHFVQHGRRQYGNAYPFVRFQRLDIEQAPATGQNLPTACDLVLAANVLHATQSIRATLQHVKARLKRHGLLILNEITTLSSFSTLTFGLLDGWWLYQDAEVRIPGSPVLSETMWHRVLAEEGFSAVDSLGESGAEDSLGQHIMVGQSDGWSLHPDPLKDADPNQNDRAINGEIIDAVATNGEIETIEPPIIASIQATTKTPDPSTSQIKLVEAQIIQTLADALDIPTHRVELDVPFSEYGVDSILAVAIINQLNQSLGIRLQRPDLFNYTTTESMAAHIVAEFGDRLPPISPSPTAPSPSTPQSLTTPPLPPSPTPPLP